MEYPKLKLNFEVGKRQDVRSHMCCPGCNALPPMMREITGTKWTTDRLGHWFEWHWKPESDEANDYRYDCGFSGVLILNLDRSIVDRQERYIAEEAAQ